MMGESKEDFSLDDNSCPNDGEKTEEFNNAADGTPVPIVGEKLAETIVSSTGEHDENKKEDISHEDDVDVFARKIFIGGIAWKTTEVRLPSDFCGSLENSVFSASSETVFDG
ncbi:unnamed protein product [Cyprideis torosa]|uniref:Uncharacterized protein n=1 Tax=Cyprideis torosa TaxID=163714 RepID=A0A7R8WCL5_9CRUS|nr:unnamed protein product [Cyprideis torosa]CAG0888518.1 unnamed protein product [Cyprideis torosa]